nr:hypothetical protein [Tanacetum cinerariifolium]
MGPLAKALNERPQGGIPSNITPNPQEDIKLITTRSDITLAGPLVPPPPPFSSSKEVHILSPESTARVPSLVIQPALISKQNEIPERIPHQPPIPSPLSFAKALAQMPKYAKMLKDLLSNREKLLELGNTPLNEKYLTVLLKKLLEKHGDPGKLLIPYDFNKLKECMALADLGVNINLFPLSVWKKLTLPELVPIRMTLELANRSVAYQAGRPFLKTAHALADVYGEYLTLRVGDEKLIFNVESALKYPHKHGNESINQIDIIDRTCEDHFHEVLNVQKSINPLSGSPTPSSDPVVTSLSPSLTPFEDSDFLLEEIDALFALDDSIPLGINEGIFKPPNRELKDLPPHIEYVFLEETLKLPVIIAKDLIEKEKDQLIKRMADQKIHEVIEAEVVKLLDA